MKSIKDSVCKFSYLGKVGLGKVGLTLANKTKRPKINIFEVPLVRRAQ